MESPIKHLYKQQLYMYLCTYNCCKHIHVMKKVQKILAATEKHIGNGSYIVFLPDKREKNKSWHIKDHSGEWVRWRQEKETFLLYRTVTSDNYASTPNKI